MSITKRKLNYFLVIFFLILNITYIFSYMHESPPPNEPGNGLESEFGTNGNNTNFDRPGDYNIPNSPEPDCPPGKPAISFNPVTLNVVIEDIPMMYRTGIGPDVILKLVYNGNDNQELTGGLEAPTQYFPTGKYFSFSYATFYHLESANEVILILPDGHREKFIENGGIFIAENNEFHDALERYSVTGGYGYCLTQKDTKLKYRYDDPIHQKITSIEDRNGNEIIINYNDDYNLSSLEDANGNTVSFTLNSDGRITQATDPLGRTIILEYGHNEDNDYLTSITDMGGFESTFTYDDVQILQQADPGYHLETRIIEVITPDGTSTIEYEATGCVAAGCLGYLIYYTNPNGSTTQISFSWVDTDYAETLMQDNNGNNFYYYTDLTASKLDFISRPAAGGSIYYGYDGDGNINSVSEGTAETTFVYDSNGNITSKTTPTGATTTYTFDANDNLDTLTDPMTVEYDYTYDSNDNLINLSSPAMTKSYTYYPNGKLHTYTDPNGYVTTYNYDSNWFISQINYPLGKTTYITNDVVGRPLSITENGQTISFEYTDLDQIFRISYPDGSSIVNNYTFLNPTSTTDRGGRTAIYAYDAVGNITSENTPHGFISYQRDLNGNILYLVVNGQTTSYIYDELNQITDAINPDGSSKSFTYDDIGNIITRTDENGTLTTYSYDYHWLTSIDYSDSTPDVTLTYNDNGDIASRQDGTGTTTYNYDCCRLTGVDGPEADDDITYTYDNAGNRLTMDLPGMSISYTYDELHRTTDVISSYASAHYDYDANGKPINMNYGNGTFTEFTYDYLNRLSSLNNKKLNGEIISGFDYAYDNASLITQIIDNQGIISSYDYDYANQLINEEVINPEGKILWQNQFTYDNMGNRLTLDKNGILDNYEYNNNNQLTELEETVVEVSGVITGTTNTTVYVEGILAHTEDLGGNQIEFRAYNVPIDTSEETVQVFAKVNEVVADVDDNSKFISYTPSSPEGSIEISLSTDIEGVDPEKINTLSVKKIITSYEYDNNGNLIQEASGDETTLYMYDAENRLTRVDLPDGDYEEYVYDGFGQRAEISKNGVWDKRYIYNDLFEAVVIKENDSNTQYLTRGKSLGGGIGGLISVYTNTEGNAYNHYNHRGDIVNVTDSQQIIISTQYYDAFGLDKNLIGDPISGFRFSTKEYDGSTQMIYYGFRYYSVKKGSWLTKDPISFAGGLNFYSFCANNPIQFVDRWGLKVGDWWDLVANYKRAQQIADEMHRNFAGNHNNLFDAMRHALWSKRTVEETNWFTAYTAGVGHEIDNLLHGGPWRETLMDLHNNSIGRNAAGQLALWCDDILNLRVNPKDSDGPY